MQKRIAIYSIADEKARLSFGAELDGIDPDCSEIIDEHATIFHSDKTLDELHKILVSQHLQAGDEAWILSLDRPYTGNGVAHEELRAFLLK